VITTTEWKAKKKQLLAKKVENQYCSKNTVEMLKANTPINFFTYNAASSALVTLAQEEGMTVEELKKRIRGHNNPEPKPATTIDDKKGRLFR
jgi:hypothetical protein